MLTSKYIRENMDFVKESLANRHSDFDLSNFDKLEKERLEMTRKLEDKKARRNKVSKEIAIAKKRGEDTTAIQESMKNFHLEIKEIEEKLHSLKEKVHHICLTIPNIIASEVPLGQNEKDNLEIMKWKDPPLFDFPIKDHVELGEKHQLLDFPRATKISGSRFVVLRNQAAILERSLINFFLDHNRQNGYTEYWVPSVVNEESLIGTSNLPKFKDDLFNIKNPEHYYLIPTGEVPLTNLYRDEIFKEENLPIKVTAYTPCYRSEAGAAGRDTRGMIRQHQFSKVEVVHFCTPEQSETEHQYLLNNAKTILEKLALPYRTVELCSGDLSFGAKRCYDLEVWLPSQNKYLEISSISNFGEFQANRAKIRYKKELDGKNYMVHTLNGSALAVGRCMIALMENNQQSNGSIKLPECLSQYTGFNQIG